MRGSGWPRAARAGLAGWLILAWLLERERRSYGLRLGDYWKLRLRAAELELGSTLDKMGAILNRKGQ